MKLGIVSDEVSEDLKVAAEWAVERGIKRFELRRVWGERLGKRTVNENQTDAG